MWPFRTDAETNLLDVRKKLAAAEGGANMTPQGKAFWNALPPAERTTTAGLPPPAMTTGLPPGAPPFASGAMEGRAPMGTMAQEQQNAWNRGSNVVAEAAVPIRQGYVFGTQPDYGRTPGAVAAVNARPPSMPGEYPMQVPGSTGSVFHSLLAGANEMKIARGEDGSVTQVTKQIHLPPGQTPDAGPPIAGGRQTTDLNQPPPGAAPISGPPPYGPTQSEQRFGRTRNWDEFNAVTNARAVAAGVIPDANGQLSDEALQRRRSNMMNNAADRQAADKQLQERILERQQTAQRASNEQIAQSQGEALAARYSIPAEARVQSAQINAQAKTTSATTTAEARKYSADQAFNAAGFQVSKVYDLGLLKMDSEEAIAAAHDSAAIEMKAGQGIIMLNGQRLTKLSDGTLINVDTGKEMHTGRGAGSIADALAGMAPKKDEKTGWLERIFKSDGTPADTTAGTPAAGATAGGQPAPGGNTGMVNSAGALTVGTVKNGFVFIGGNPADKNNWSPVRS